MLTNRFLDDYRGRQPQWGFNGLGYIVYKRTYSRPLNGRSEEWWETVRRVVTGAQEIGAGYTAAEMERLYDHIFNLRGTFAGRGLWQLGTDNPHRIGADSLVNCWWTSTRKIEDFVFLFNELMLGGGVGFSVKRADAGALGRVVRGVKIRLAKGGTAHDADFIIPDKREGWGELLRMVLESYFKTGKSFTYSTVLIRGKGELIKTFGGTASGPGILVDGVDKIQDVLIARSGRSLRSIDVLDIANIIGSIVVAGNVRRSAQIAIGDPDDLAFLKAKRWDLGSIPPHRAMSNNTVDVGSLDELAHSFWDGYKGNGEPYGFFNLAAAQRWGRAGEENFDGSIEGVNPCGEIPLADRESCNLTEVFLPRIKSREIMDDVMMLLYKGQKAIAAMPFQDPTTERIAHRNMRLGMSVSGIAQSLDKVTWLDGAYRSLKSFDEFWSHERDYPESIRLTTVKPSGTVSLLAGVTSGIHPGHSEHHIRRIRIAANDPMADYCRNLGVPIEFSRVYGEEDRSTVVAEFPGSFPPGTPAADTSALDQLNLLKTVQHVWADNAISATVSFHPEELSGIKDWLKENWDTTKSVSFLPRKHGFDQPPYEEIDAVEYDRRVAEMKPITEAAGNTFVPDIEEDCPTGSCPIR